MAVVVEALLCFALHERVSLPDLPAQKQKPLVHVFLVARPPGPLPDKDVPWKGRGMAKGHPVGSDDQRSPRVWHSAWGVWRVHDVRECKWLPLTHEWGSGKVRMQPLDLEA